MRSPTFSPDGTKLATGCDEGFVVIDVTDLRPRLVVRTSLVPSVAFGPDSTTLAVQLYSARVKLWNLATNQELASLADPTPARRSWVAIGDDGRTLASGSLESVRLWDLAGASERLTISGTHAWGATCVSFSPDGSTLVSTSKDGTIKLWNPTTGRHLRTLGPYPSDVQGCAFSPDGSLLAAASLTYEGWLRVWDTKRWVEVYSGVEGSCDGLAFSRGEGEHHALLASAGKRGGRIWRVERMGDGRIGLRPIVTHTSCAGVALSPDGSLAAFASHSVPGHNVPGRRPLKIWDIARARELPFSGPNPGPDAWYALAFRSPRELVYVAADGTAVVWDVVADRRVCAIGRPGAFAAGMISLSPDGRWLAALATSSSVAVIDLERAEIAFNLREETSPIFSLAWSPDARRLAVGLSDGGLSIWDRHKVQARLDELGLGAR
jgi:WD40 repeat protein